jgi:ribosomal protein S18 acetylase RimI-like enzyme
VIRTLTAADFDAVYEAFLDAFSDYVVKLSPTREQLAEMLTRRGYVPEMSIGVFDENRLVAFTLNGIDGDRAYDSGTGVVISHRRRGLARQVMQACFEVLGSRSYVLEVIDSNRPAIELYRGLGFRETRGLQSYSLTAVQSYSGDAGAPVRLYDCTTLAPSWQNSDASLARARDEHVTLSGGGGEVVLFPNTGDLAQMRGRVGMALLQAALERAGKPLRIMNVDEREPGLGDFLEAAGAVKIVRQLEMLRA